MDFVVLALFVDLCVGFAVGKKLTHKGRRLAACVGVPFVLALPCWANDLAKGGETANWASVAFWVAFVVGLAPSFVGMWVGRRVSTPDNAK
jgi:hypothetical protein